MSMLKPLMGLYATSLVAGAALAGWRMRQKAELYDTAAPGATRVNVTYSDDPSLSPMDSYQSSARATSPAVHYVPLNEDRFVPSVSAHDSFRNFVA